MEFADSTQQKFRVALLATSKTVFNFTSDKVFNWWCKFLLMPSVHLQYEGLDTFWTSLHCYQQFLSLRFSAVSPKSMIVNAQLILYLHIVNILKQKISRTLCTIALKFMHCKLNLNARNKEILQYFGYKPAGGQVVIWSRQRTKLQGCNYRSIFKMLIYLPLLAYSATNSQCHE